MLVFDQESVSPWIWNALTYTIEKFLSITGFDKLTWTDFIISLLIPVFCFTLELAFIGWNKSSLRLLITNLKKTKGDLICYFLQIGMMTRLLSVILTLGIGYWLVGVIQRSLNLNLIYHIDSEVAQFAILMLVGDFKAYVRHWMLHRYGWSWEIHKYHHSAEHLTMLTAERAHFLEVTISQFFNVIPLIVFGMPLKIYIWAGILNNIQQYLLHSQLNHNWGWLGKYILVSPAAHRIHHSSNPKHFGKNFGYNFIFWDRMFGTYHKPEEVTSFGIPDNPFNRKSFVHDILFAYKRTLWKLAGKEYVEKL